MKVTPNCCDAHAQGAAAVEGCSNASDVPRVSEQPVDIFRKLVALVERWTAMNREDCPQCGKDGFPYRGSQERICRSCGHRWLGSMLTRSMPTLADIPPMDDRLSLPQESQREKCGRWEHEADGDMKIVAHPVGSYIFAEDRRTRTEAGLKMCRHCRSLYVPR